MTDIKAKYANYFEVGFNACEVLLDFAQCHESDQRVSPHTRLVTSPIAAKALLKLLSEALSNYEQRFGTLEDAHH